MLKAPVVKTIMEVSHEPVSRGRGSWRPVQDRIGIDIHQLTDDAGLDLIRDSGMGWVRVDFDWWTFNPAPGVFDFSTLDHVVAKATARGLKIYPSIGYTPTWATSGEFRTGVPDHVGDWTRAVTTAVTRYRDDIWHWGIWNEPNTTSFWTGTRQQFIDVIVQPAADAIHAADPDALVVGPELAHFVSSKGVFYEWLARLAPQCRLQDVIGHSPLDQFAQLPLDLVEAVRGAQSADALERPLVVVVLHSHRQLLLGLFEAVELHPSPAPCPPSLDSR